MIRKFYERRVLPRLIDLAMRADRIEAERRRVVPLATGRVLEVGFGSGLNVSFYGPDVERLVAVDPSIALWRLAERRVARAPFPLEFVQAEAEHLPFQGGMFDTALMTWTLCSIADPLRALREVQRVLRPAARLVFVEHGRAPDARVRAWQDGLTPWWRRMAGGCELNREIAALVVAAGFRLTQLEAAYGEGPRPFVYFYRGVAEPAR